MIIFSLQHMLPGDPALMLAGENPDEAALSRRLLILVFFMAGSLCVPKHKYLTCR